jgi:hypothetical protein
MAINRSFVPWWSEKTSLPDFCTWDKIDNVKFQWELRTGLEKIKQRHAEMISQDKIDPKTIGKELNEYVHWAYD